MRDYRLRIDFDEMLKIELKKVGNLIEDRHHNNDDYVWVSKNEIKRNLNIIEKIVEIIEMIEKEGE